MVSQTVAHPVIPIPLSGIILSITTAKEEEITKLKKQISTLEEENARLEEENNSLRKKLESIEG